MLWIIILNIYNSSVMFKIFTRPAGRLADQGLDFAGGLGTALRQRAHLAATTAKPRPCSPARADPQPAFSARMLVWKAIPSITPMMSPIWREAWLMSPSGDHAFHHLAAGDGALAGGAGQIVGHVGRVGRVLHRLAQLVHRRGGGLQVRGRLFGAARQVLVPAAIWVLAVASLSDDTRTEATISAARPACASSTPSGG